MNDHSTQNILDAAFELGISNEHLINFRQIDDVLYFDSISGSKYNARLTKHGKLKKNSVRKES